MSVGDIEKPVLTTQSAEALPRAAALAGWVLAVCLLTLLNVYLGAFLSLPAFGTAAGHLISVLYLGVLLFAVLFAARAAARLPVSTGFLLTAGTVLSLPILLQILGNVAHLPESLNLLADFLPFTGQIIVSNLLAPLGMTLLGSGLGRILKHPNTLLAGAGVAIFFDIVVVTMGTVAQFLKNNASAITAVSLGAGGGTASAAAHARPGVPIPHLPPPLSTVTIGPADVLFMAFFLSAVWHLNLSHRKTMGWMYALLGAALVLVETTGLPIPALAPMGAALLIANYRHAAFTKQERRDLVIGGVFAVFCAGLMIVGARRFVPAAAPQEVHFGFYPIRRTENDPFLVQAVIRDSPAEKGGLRPGDVLLTINNVPTPGMTLDQFNEQRHKSAKTGMALHIQRRGESKPRDLLLEPGG